MAAADADSRYERNAEPAGGAGQVTSVVERGEAPDARPVRATRRLGRPVVLDGVRGLAVALVVLFHTKVMPGNGYVGVDVFFVLSGFLITTLLCEEHANQGRIHLRSFYARRARRLLPALVLLIGGALIASLVTTDLGGHWPVALIAVTVLVFAANWVTVVLGPGTLGALSPTWSLAEEEQFYMLWPALLALLLRLRVAWVLTILLVVIVALVCGADVMQAAVPQWQLYFNPVDRAAELLLGAVVSVVWRDAAMGSRLSALLRSPLVGWLVIALGAWTVRQSVMSDYHTYRLSALLAAVLLLHALARPHSLLGRLLSLPPLRYTGKISYGLYLYHLPITWTVHDSLAGSSVWVQASISIAVAYLVAVLSYHVVESRFLRRRTAVGRAASVNAN